MNTAPKVTFISAEAAQRLETPSNVISINSPHEHTHLPTKHTRLLILSFYPNDYHDFGEQGPTEKTARKIIDFAISCNNEDIVVHCGEGRMRSAAVAVFLEMDLDYEIDFRAPGCLGTVAHASDKLTKLLRRTFRPFKKQVRKLKSAGHDVIKLDWEHNLVQYVPSNLKADRFPGYVFGPEEEGLTELTQDERQELYLSQFEDPLAFNHETLAFPIDRTDALCLLNNNRIPTHKYAVGV